MAQRLLGRLRHARYLFFFAVVSTLLAAALVMLYGTVQIAAFVVELVRHGTINQEWGAELRLTVIEVVDLFLIGTVLFVIAVGLYQLFFAGLAGLQGLGAGGDGGEAARALLTKQAPSPVLIQHLKARGVDPADHGPITAQTA